MYSIFKRITVFALMLLMLIMGTFVLYRKVEAATMYYNTSAALLNCSVNSNGLLEATLSVTGIKNRTTHISVELYVEKKILGLFWSRINIGYPDNIWTDSTTNYLYSNIFTTSLPSEGTYRVTVTFTVSGTGGANDVIVKTNTISY